MNITNGTYYNLNLGKKDYKNRTILLYDVLPFYLNDQEIHEVLKKSNLRILKVKQYKGYLCQLTNVASYEEYLNERFNSKGRRKIKKFKRKLLENFEVKEKYFFGHISREDFDEVFGAMVALIRKRFNDLGEVNNILEKQNYYYQLIFEMVNSKNGMLQVLYCDQEPMAVTFNFVSDDHMYFAINTFQTDLRRYNIMHIMIIGLLNWCFEHKMNILDFSKGSYEYKRRWSNVIYDFENHILFDKSSLTSIVIACYIKIHFQIKQLFRDWQLNRQYSRIKFQFGNKSRKKKYALSVTPLKEYDLQNYERVDHMEATFKELRGVIFDLIYSNPQPAKEVRLYRKKGANEFLVLGKKLQYRISYK